MKISRRKISLKEALRRRAQRHLMQEALAHSRKKSLLSKHYILKEEDDSDLIDVEDTNVDEVDTEIDDDDVDDEIDDEVEDDDTVEVTSGEDDEVRDAIKTLAARLGMTADDFADLGEETEESICVEDDTKMISAKEFFDECDDRKRVFEDDEDPEVDTSDDSSEEDSTTDLSVDTDVADLSGATDLSDTTDISGNTEVSGEIGTVDNPATSEEEKTAETAQKLAEMTPEDWFKLLNQI